jgi:hypothetical protein
MYCLPQHQTVAVLALAAHTVSHQHTRTQMAYKSGLRVTLINRANKQAYMRIAAYELSCRISAHCCGVSLQDALALDVHSVRVQYSRVRHAYMCTVQ